MYKIQAPYSTRSEPVSVDRQQLADELKKRVKQQRMSLFENSIVSASPLNRSNQGS